MQEEIRSCNKEGDLHIQLVTNEPKAFDGMMAHYGEQIVLLAQMLGLNTCWVAMTVSKGVVKKNIEIATGEKPGIIISLGYGTTQGVSHKSKDMHNLSDSKVDLGIVKYHFEVGAGKENFNWSK